MDMLPLWLALSILTPPEPSPEEVRALVDKVQRHYDSLYDFEGEFTQRYERRLVRKTVVETGRIAVKKPGRMRWEYQTPDEKLFVTDGSKSYFYIPLEKQVVVSHAPEGAMGMAEGSPFELLAGKSRITDSFTFFSSDEPPTEGGTMLHLIPSRRQEDFEDVELEVSPADGQVLRVVLIDGQRNRTEFVFRNIRKNVGIPETAFRFAIPSGVEVVVHSEAKP
jgi:outer membrane lipoprotein carrier protein